MATKKTSPFVLSETVIITATGVTTTGSIDLGSYVDVSSKTGIAVLEADFIYQVVDTNELVAPVELSGATKGWWAGAQVFDQTRDDLQIADDNSLIASSQFMSLDYDASQDNDVFPDSYPAPGRISISPQMTVVGTCDSSAAFAANHTLYITARLTCVLVRLSEKDWMGIAIQGQALQG